VPQDHAEAVKWYRRAAEQGDMFAHHDLAQMYRNGEGVPQDYPTAHMWFNIAAANGSEIAPSMRDHVADKMTPEAILEAQKRARLCMESDYQNCN